MPVMEALWNPPTEQNSAMARFQDTVNSSFKLQLTDYHSLWSWSVEDVERFWGFWWQQADLIASHQPTSVFKKGQSFESDTWFVDARLNFAENLFRYRDETSAI
ncbi:MAG: acetoacetate--CoA ligase, partial [Gammaproteobacteria bacterium]|nr:acetoacetate--CoA ligase [Gammaproteobacteria bacterium]